MIESLTTFLCLRLVSVELIVINEYQILTPNPGNGCIIPRLILGIVFIKFKAFFEPDIFDLNLPETNV